MLAIQARTPHTPGYTVASRAPETPSASALVQGANVVYVAVTPVAVIVASDTMRSTMREPELTKVFVAVPHTTCLVPEPTHTSCRGQQREPTIGTVQSDAGCSWQ